MNKNLRWKVVVILGTLLVFLFGIFGFPWEWSGKTPISAMTDRIHLGLDLKGGTHLILQVQVNDAVNAETDRAVERLRDNLRSHNVPYADLSKPDPVNAPERISIKGVPPENSGDLRSIVTDQLATYDLNSGPENSWNVTMKPAEVTAIKNNAVTQAIETIRNRIDQLGVSEPVIEEHGL